MMAGTLIYSFQSEWLKQRRSLGSWLVVVGALFTPVIVIVSRLIHHDKLPEVYAASNFWTSLWKNSWESMAVFFLPMAAILMTSLITQIEYRNNAWKQVQDAAPRQKVRAIARFAPRLVALGGLRAYAAVRLRQEEKADPALRGQSAGSAGTDAHVDSVPSADGARASLPISQRGIPLAVRKVEDSVQ